MNVLKMENNKKFIRSNKAQIAYLCQFMAGHPAFAAGDYRTPLGASSCNSQWEKLKRELDELGPQRSVEQWKICWRDQKRKAREEGGASTKARNATGNCVEIPQISDNAVHVLNTIGQEMAVGCGPEESPIGFTQETTTPLPALGQLQAEHALEPVAFPSTSGMQNVVPQQQGPQTGQRPAPPSGQKSRARKVLPHDRFLAAQLESNNLAKAANALRKQANVLREAANVQRAEANALRREAAITAQRHLSYLIAKDKKEEESARLRCPPPSNSEHN
ncbi:uncharacterized protein [Maniola hyperantus]|uniref:uncharacterized protein isoform X1 n=2 Tax=Aphantopus hyperantus TaxID=2795564 RepID=UPI00213C6FDF